MKLSKHNFRRFLFLFSRKTKLLKFSALHKLYEVLGLNKLSFLRQYSLSSGLNMNFDIRFNDYSGSLLIRNVA